MTDYTQTTYVAADATGRITVKGNVPRYMVDIQVPPDGGTIVMGDADLLTDYVANGVITPRPANPSTLAGMKISNVPNPSTVTIGTETAATVTDGEVDLEFTQPGTYTVLVQCWPYVDATFTVTADETATQS